MIKKIISSFALLFPVAMVTAQNGLENIVVEKYYVSDAADAAGSVGALPVGSVTYRVWADLLPGYNFQALYGLPGHNLTVQTSTTFFNNEDYGGTTPTISSNNVRKNSALLDSYFSVGGSANGRVAVFKADDLDGSPGNADGILQNNDATASGAINIGTTVNLAAQDGMIVGTPVSVTYVGIPNTGNGDLGVLDGFSQIGGLFTTNSGSVAALGGATGATVANRVLVGQFTTDGCFQFELNVQIGTPLGGTENYVAINPIGSEITIPSLIQNFGPCALAPVANFTATDQQFCATGSATFNDASTNSPTSWAWSFPGGIPATSTAQNPTVTYMVRGTYDVSLTATNGAGANPITKTSFIVIDSLPVSNITPGANQTICKGANITLTAATNVPSASYQWQKNNVNIPGAVNATLNVTQQAAYRVLITNTNNLCSKRSVPVTVFTQQPTAPITAAGNTSFCSGGNVDLQTAGSGSNNFQWFRNNVVIAGATAPIYSASSYGSYRVRITDALGCSNTSGAVYVTVNQNPNVTVTPSGPLTFCAGQSVNITIPSQAGVTYQWKKDGTNIGGATLNSLTANTTGRYRVTATRTTTGCTNTSSNQNVLVNCRTGSDEFISETILSDAIEVFPNPANDNTTVKFSIAEEGNVSISVFDLSGKKFTDVVNNFYHAGLHEQSVNTANLTQGIYLVKLTSKDSTKHVKLVVNH